MGPGETSGLRYLNYSVPPALPMISVMSEPTRYSTFRVRRFTSRLKGLSSESWGLPLAISSVFIWGSRLATWLAYPSGVRFPDSSSYAPSSFGDWSLISFGGEAIRPWPVPLFFSLLPSDSSRIAAQLVMSGATWTLLIVLLAAFIRPGWPRVGFMTLSSVVAAAPATLQWDTVILAQTFHTSLVVGAVFLALLAFRRRVGWPHVASVLAILALLGFTKITHLPLVAIFAVVYALLMTRGRASRSKLLTFLMGALVSLTAPIPLHGNVDEYWEFTYSGSNALYALGAQTPGSDNFKAFLQLNGVPECIVATAPYENWEEDVEDPIRRGCPEAKPFIRNELSGLLLEYRLTRPLETLRVGAQGLGAATISNSLRYGGSVSLVPEALSSLVFGKSDPDVLVLSGAGQIDLSQQVLSGEGFWVFAPQFMWIMLGLAALLVLIRRNRIQDERRMASVLLVLILALLLESLGSLMLLSSEWVRLVSPYLNPILVLSIFSIALLLAPRRAVPRLDE